MFAITLVIICSCYLGNTIYNLQEEINKLKRRVDQLEEEKCNGKCNCIQHS